MNSSYDAEVRRLAGTLAEIAHALEGSDDVDDRVRHVLVLTRELVPYERCLLLKALPGTEPALLVVPNNGLSDQGQGRLLRTMLRLFNLVGAAEEIGRSEGPEPQLALPVMGLDQVIGVVRVEPPLELSYEAKHLRLLSVVAAQLGAYLTMIRLREEDARHTNELAVAHDFQQLLVGVVSHDLRNPLGVISMVAAQLLKNARDAQQAKAIERALKNAKRAERIINDLLDVTRVRVTGEMALTRKRMDLVAVIREAVDDALLHGAKIELVTDLAEVHGEWDPDRLSQIATNLINNAVQYGARDEAVRVAVHGDAREARLTVHNRGASIPSDFLAVIFDPFKRGAERRGSTGLGLGLFIVDQIVRAHGGRVEAHSSESEGTTFVVSLPIDASTAVHPSWGVQPAAAPAKEDDPQVMVVDDDRDGREAMAAILEQQGYTVVQAENGAEALAILRSGHRPKLILLDLAMPVMDGETFHKICRADPDLSSIPVFITSADAASAVKLARSGGATGCLTKPIEFESLLMTVGPHLRT